MPHRSILYCLALAIAVLLSPQSATSQTLNEILELVQNDSTTPRSIRKWRTVSREEAAEAEYVLSEIWNAATEETDGGRFGLRREIDLILAQVDGLEEFHNAWRSSHKYPSSPIRSVDIPIPYDRTGMDWARALLENYSNEELAEAFKKREDTFTTPIGRMVSEVSVWKAALYLERDTYRVESIKLLLQEISDNGDRDGKVAADALAEEAMRTCDLLAFDAAVSQADASNWIKHAFWRARIVQGGPELAIDPRLFENPSQTLAGYEAILRYGYCDNEFSSVGELPRETYKINIFIDGDELQHCPEMSASEHVKTRCRNVECLIVVETHRGYHNTYFKRLSRGDSLQVNGFVLSDYSEIRSDPSRPDIKCVRQDDDIFCLSLQSLSNDSCLAATDALNAPDPALKE